MLTIFCKRGSLNHLSLSNFPTFSGSKKFQLIKLETHVSIASSQWYRRYSTDSGSMGCIRRAICLPVSSGLFPGSSRCTQQARRREINSLLARSVGIAGAAIRNFCGAHHIWKMKDGKAHSVLSLFPFFFSIVNLLH